MTSPAEIARALLDEPCPHAGSPFKPSDLDCVDPIGVGAGPRKASCDLCLAAALTEYGDARAMEEREACAVLIERRGAKALNASVSGVTMAFCELIRARTP